MGKIHKKGLGCNLRKLDETMGIIRFWPLLVLIGPSFFWQSPAAYPASAAAQPPAAAGEIALDAIPADPRGGKAYRLVYRIEAPIGVYWRFKTDFDNDFLESSPFIQAHRLVRQDSHGAITETRYTHAPQSNFKWRTTVSPKVHRLDFLLLNPRDVQQKFHYGFIQLEPLGPETRVTQVAYFDFWGVSLWAAYPWGGGMRDFLLSTARWEQETVVRLKGRYQDGDGPVPEPGKFAPTPDLEEAELR